MQQDVHGTVGRCISVINGVPSANSSRHLHMARAQYKMHTTVRCVNNCLRRCWQCRLHCVCQVTATSPTCGIQVKMRLRHIPSCAHSRTLLLLHCRWDSLQLPPSESATCLVQTKHLMLALLVRLTEVPHLVHNSSSEHSSFLQHHYHTFCD